MCTLHMKNTHTCTCIYQELHNRPNNCNRAWVQFQLLSRGISLALINLTTNMNMPGVPIKTLPISTIYIYIYIYIYTVNQNVIPIDYIHRSWSIYKGRVLSDGGHKHPWVLTVLFSALQTDTKICKGNHIHQCRSSWQTFGFGGYSFWS